MIFAKQEVFSYKQLDVIIFAKHEKQEKISFWQRISSARRLDKSLHHLSKACCYQIEHLQKV